MLKRIRTTGQAIIEFAFAALLLSLLLAAAVDLGLIFFTLQGLHNATTEGAQYGSLMDWEDNKEYHCKYNPDDCDGVKDEDSDGDGFVYQDIFSSSPYVLSPEKLTEDPEWDLYPSFVNAVRYRTVYEAGQSGGIMRSRLRDLDGDGVTDDFNTIKHYVDVKVTRDDDEDSYKCDPNRTTEQCYIHVSIRARYKIFFPLAPAFKEWVNLRSHFSLALSKQGYSEGGAADNEPIRITNTPTISGTSPLTPATPTATPEVDICSDVTSNVTDLPEWSYDYIGGGSEVIGRANIGGGSVKMCGAGLRIQEPGAQLGDFAYYVYKNDETSRNKVQFIAYLPLGDWQPAVNGSGEHYGAGLMVRRTPSNAEGVPFAGVIFRDGRVAFEYRESEAGDVQIYGSPTDVSGASGVWLRLERYEDTVAASFNTSSGAGSPPGEGEWTHLKTVGDSTFLQIPALAPANTTTFGMALASGNKYLPSSPNDDDAARVTFQSVQFKDMEGFDAVFEHPDPDKEPFQVTSRDDMDFRLKVLNDGGGSINVSSVRYFLSKDDATSDWDLGGDSRCVFGGTSAPNDCNPPDENFYNSVGTELVGTELMSRRGVYTIRAVITLDNGETRPATSRFELPDMHVEFVNPERNSRGRSPVSDGDTIEVETREETRFEIEAYDEKYGTDIGDGIAEITYRVNDVPTDDGTPLYEQTHAAPIAQTHMCLFGESGGECNMMPDVDVYNEMTPEQNYYVTVIVKSQDGTTSKKTLNFVRASVAARFYTTDGGRVELNNNDLVDTEEKSRFEVEAWDLGAATPENGAGIEQIRVTILGTSGMALGYTSEPYEITPAGNESKFCVFGRTGNKCNPMPDYYSLERGKYVMTVQMRLQGSSEWVPALNKAPSVIFEIPELPIEIEFVDETGTPVDNSQVRYVTSIDDLDDLFRVHAYKNDQPGVTQNGRGIAQVQFELFVYPMNDNPIVLKLDNAGNSARPYCAFGATGNTCNPMSEELFAQLRSGRHYVKVTAQEEVPGVSDGRWEGPEEFYFEIPPIAMKFVDPDPNDPDAPDKDDLADDDEYYYDDDYKVVRDLDATKFEIVAYDPRYCDTLPETCKANPNEDECFDACHGSGITGLDFDVYGPYDKDATRYRQTPGDMIDDLSEINGDDDLPYTDGSGDPMCAFDRSGSQCETAFADADDPEEEFLNMERGKYFITANVKNTNNQWSGKVIERQFYLEDLHLEFLEDTWDRVIAYDPRAGRESGDGIDRVEFRLYAPDHDREDPWPWKVENTNPITVTIDPDPDGDDHVDGEPYCMFGYNTAESRCYGRPSVLDEDMVSGRYYVEAEAWGIYGDDTSVEEQESFTWEEGSVRAAFVDPRVMSATLTVRNVGVISPTTLTDIEIKAAPKSSISLFNDNGLNVRKVRAIIQKPDGTTVYKEFTSPPYCLFGNTGNVCATMGPSEPSGQYRIITRAQEDDGTYFLWSDPVEMVYSIP